VLHRTAGFVSRRIAPTDAAKIEQKAREQKMADFSGFVMPKCYAFDPFRLALRGNR
jgi:hypothetical protein